MTRQGLFLLLFCTASQVLFAQGDALDNYVNRLKQSQASGGSETAFLSAGSDFMYGWECGCSKK